MYKFLVFPLMVALLWVAPSSAQAQCGDVDNSGFVDISDLIYLVSYIASNGPPPPDSTKADMDNRAGITIGDLAVLTDQFFGGGATFDCVIDDVYYFSCSTEDTISVPFKHKILSNINTIDLPVIVTWGPSTRGYYLPFVLDGSGGNGTFAYDQFITNKSTIDYWAIGDTVYFNDVALSTGSFRVDTLGYFRYQRVSAGEGVIVSQLVARSDVLRPSVLQDAYQLYSPIMIYKYPDGDYNCDTEVNVEDLTYFVAFLFQGGPPPCNVYGGP